MAKVIVTIDPATAETTYDVNGVVGPSCKDITDFLKQNAELLEERPKAEFVEQEHLPEYLDNL